jgi:acyl carrier protein
MISNELKKVILSELRLDEWEMSDDTSPPQIPGWDSLMHVNVITAVEKHFNVRFTTGEIVRLKNIGELQRLVDMKSHRNA